MNSSPFLSIPFTPRLVLPFKGPVVISDLYSKLQNLLSTLNHPTSDDLQVVKSFLREIRIPLNDALMIDPIPTLTVRESPRRKMSASFTTRLNLDQRRTFFTFYTRWKSNEVESALEQANAHPSDARAQADLYALLIARDPDMVIGRFEDARYARDEECVVYYVTALQATDQVERASRFILDPSKKQVVVVVDKEDGRKEVAGGFHRILAQRTVRCM